MVSCLASCPKAGCPSIFCCKQDITGRSSVSGPFFLFTVSGVWCVMTFFCVLAPELSEETFPTILLITKLMKVTYIYISGKNHGVYIFFLNDREPSVLKACPSLSHTIFSSMFVIFSTYVATLPKSSFQDMDKTFAGHERSQENIRCKITRSNCSIFLTLWKVFHHRAFFQLADSCLLCWCMC